MTLTLKTVSAALGVIAFFLLAASIIFLGNQRLAYAIGPIDPVRPVERIRSVDAVTPIEPVGAVDPISFPADPIGPVDSVGPIESVGPLSTANFKSPNVGLPFTDPPTGSQILCYLNQLEEVNGFPVYHPPIPIFDVGECGGPLVTECSNAIDDDADNLIDAADPACHTDGNAGNPSSYDGSLDDESLFIPQCRDGLDNDSDSVIDTADSGCHTDGDASNAGSYDPDDNSESTTPGVENTLPLCSDGLDNDGDSLVDLDDPARMLG